MHKSILTIGLLASSLVMLTVMPFLNNNSFSPTEAKAVLEYGMDNYKKYKDNSNVEEIIECSNTNVNNNGFNGVQASDEGEVGASSSGSGGSDGRPSSAQASDKWCINHNEFVVIDRGGGTTPEPETCEECFEAFSISRPD